MRAGRAAWPAVALSAACFTNEPALKAGIAQVRQQPEKTRLTLQPLAEQGNDFEIGSAERTPPLVRRVHYRCRGLELCVDGRNSMTWGRRHRALRWRISCPHCPSNL